MLETLFFYTTTVILIANVIALFEVWHILDTGLWREIVQDEED